MKEERGSASIYIELKDATIKVYHGTDNSILDIFTAYEGSWAMIWEGINNAKEINIKSK